MVKKVKEGSAPIPPSEAPSVNVGIMTEKLVTFVFNETYVHTQNGEFLSGEHRALFVNGNIVFNGKLYDELFFEPSSPTASFDLKAVTIGVDFHWQRKEDQRFRGALDMVVSGESIVVINQVDVEEYLSSVISSEMSATASAEFLKAHAVISRSWLLAQMEKNNRLNDEHAPAYQTTYRTDEELIRWYDREDHTIFDVCADDHCQRYQGVTRASTPLATEVIRETRGEILVHDGAICDTRFSKCCGGITEKFEHVWEPVPHPYLTALRDSREDGFPDLRIEAEAGKWIRTSPAAFCNTQDKDILSQVLNNYDQETTDFYRWQVAYSQEQLSELIARKSGIDFGWIIDLIPLRRGASGRIEKLKILGSRLSYTIGKELEIRRTLSETHLYSSAFVIDKEPGEEGFPRRFILTGAGWGHGVGLCQIGAAVMGARGYDYRQILAHYFPGAEIEKRY
ncbi:MAG: SpoIID/LytB domain-containing protein [Tannerellaceae bacterium]|jgi:SpoIID/LytB domain protein|nr:SpoIID/LytB domain-containing protein [Tannerellaceae bacterium]